MSHSSTVSKKVPHGLYFLVYRVSTVGTPLSFSHFFSLSLSSPSFSLFFSSLSFLSFPLILFFLHFPSCYSLLYKQLPHPIYILLHVPCMLTHGMPCVTHMACHVSHMHRPLPCIVTHGHGSPCVIHMACHVSPDTCCIEKREISTISEFNEIRLGS